MECDFNTFLCGSCDYSSKVATIITRYAQKCVKITFHIMCVSCGCECDSHYQHNINTSSSEQTKRGEGIVAVLLSQKIVLQSFITCMY